MKKKIMEPEIEIIKFSDNDMIVTSDCYYDESCEGCDVECTNKCLREGSYKSGFGLN